MARRLSDSESLLWGLGQNPHLGSTMGVLAMLDGNPDPQRFKTTVARAVANVAGLHERVKESQLPMEAPSWVADRHFDLDHHLRFVRLRPRPSDSELEDFVCQIVNDPFDRTRPLWQIFVVGGLRSRRSAVLFKLHHSVADGKTALKLAEHLLEFEANAAASDPIDLDAAIARLSQPEEDSADRSLAEAIRVGAERLIGLINETAGTLSQSGRLDPSRISAVGSEAAAAGRSLFEHLPGTSTEASPLLADRSRNRNLYLLSGSLPAMKAAAKERSLTLNDLFVGLAATAVTRYHQNQNADIESLAATAIISTRQPGSTSNTDKRANAFLPVTLTVPGDGATLEERSLAVGHQIRAKREHLAEQPDLLGVLGSVAGLMPSALVASLALEQASRVDFATSNLPGSPIPVWIARTKVKQLLPVGPVAGTAFNLTLLSYDAQLQLGLHIDPAAVTDPAELCSLLVESFADVGVALST